MSQYSKKYIKDAAKETLQALKNGDPRASALIIAISAMTNLDQVQILHKLERLAATTTRKKRKRK